MNLFNKNLRHITSAVALSVAGLLAMPTLMAQELPKGTFATVNGQPLSDSLLSVNVDANIARGQADTPQLREVIEHEIIGREVLAQEA